MIPRTIDGIDGENSIQFDLIFNIDEIQRLQDLFSDATGVASVITDPSGTPITKTSNFCKLCDLIIRNTENRKQQCFQTDGVHGKYNALEPIVHPCLGKGLWDASVSITVEGQFVANWIIGPIRTESADPQKMIQVAEEIGANKADFLEALKDVPVMTLARFHKIANMLFVFANELSDKAFRFQGFEKQIVAYEQSKSVLLEKEYFLKEIQEIARLGTYTLNVNMGIWESSEILDRIFGIPFDFDKSVQGWTSIIHPDWQDIMSTYFKEEVIGQKCKFDKQYKILRKVDHQERWVHGIGKLIFDNEGRPMVMLGTIRDITEQKRDELLLQQKNDEIEAQNEEYAQLNKELLQVNEELNYSKERAVESDRLKTAFLQNMSHEIRTPMNAIMGFSGLLVNQYNNKPKLEKYTEIINQRCTDLLYIVNDILDIAKIDSGQLSVNKESFHLDEMFVELSAFISDLQKRLGKESIHFSMHCPDDSLQNIIVADKVKLRQIFINLIHNAFKFTESGSIEGGCKFDEHDNLIFYVADTGIGVPADKQEFIFERFTQLNMGLTKNAGGNGLGLSIVKGLIELLGGKIFLDSEIDKGSTFSFSFPFRTINPEFQINEKNEAFNQFHFEEHTVLIVEDDPYNIEYLREVLTETGLRIIETTNGKDVMGLLANHSIDLILMDIRLIDTDGYEVTKQIRQHNTKVKIIAQTAYASLQEKQKALDVGCNEYISKPINQKQLLIMIQKQLGQ